MFMVQRGQGDAIVVAILASAALVLGLALWSMFASSISSMRPSMDITRILAQERVDTEIVKLVDDVNMNHKILIYQISRLDYTPTRIYIIVLGLKEGSYTAISSDLHKAYVYPQSKEYIDVTSSGWNAVQYEEIPSRSILVESSSGSTNFVELSTWVGSTYLKVYNVYVEGAPTIIKIDIDLSTLPPDIDGFAIMFAARIGSALYVIDVDTTFV